MALTGTMPAVEVPGSPAVPYPFGLFSIAPAATPAEPHWSGGGVWWQSAGCTQVGITHDPCTIDDDVPALDDNVACGIVDSGDPFTVYAKSARSIGGTSEAEKTEQARQLLLAGEQWAVETVLWAALMAATATPSTAVAHTVGEAIARLEGIMPSVYAGTPTLHMSRYAATLGFEGIGLRVDGSRMRTALGSPIIAGGGYGDPLDTLAEQSVIASGPVVVYRGEVKPPIVGYDRDTNESFILVQRTYVLGWDCTAVRVALS